MTHDGMIAHNASEVYKLLKQGARGFEHIITFPAAFTEWLVKEWGKLDLTDGGPLWEFNRLDGGLLGLNLRLFKAAGNHLDKLVVVCLKTGRRSWGKLAELQLV